MDRTPVESTFLKSIGHDGVDTLEAEFTNGRIFQYSGVTPDAHAALMGSASKGQHFGRHIRANFKGVDVTPVPTEQV